VARKRDKSVSIDAPLGPDNEGTLADIIPADVETPDDITVTPVTGEPDRPWDGEARR